MAGERAGEVGSEIWTIPNILSMLRLALVPVFLVFIVRMIFQRAFFGVAGVAPRTLRVFQERMRAA